MIAHLIRIKMAGVKSVILSVSNGVVTSREQDGSLTRDSTDAYNAQIIDRSMRKHSDASIMATLKE